MLCAVTVGLRRLEELSAEEVGALVRAIGPSFDNAASALEKNRVDGKTLCTPELEQLYTVSTAEGGLGLVPMQKIRLKKELEAFQ